MLLYEYATLGSMISEQNMSDISRDKTSLSLKVFQTHTPFEGLAFTPDGDVVKLRTVTVEVYDGLKIKGKFVKVGTYKYETSSGSIKTVPVFVPKSDYKDYKKLESSGIYI